tara:strand:- start:225 stop:575 length:351 start_codon:yes stop_codon:yes gene_type:complete
MVKVNYNFSILTIYLLLIVLIKLLFSLSFIRISFYKIFYSSSKKDLINELSESNDNIEWLFFTLVFLLMMYLFISNKKNIIISGNVKHILFACGFVGVYHQLQERNFFNLFKFLHL